MRRLIIILLSFSMFIHPAGTLGEIYHYTDEQGTAIYTDSLDKVPPSKMDQVRHTAGKFTPPPRSWAAFKPWLKFQEYQIENFVMAMSILDRLFLGLGLTFFGLATLYVLLFRSSVAGSLPRFLFRVLLILILIMTSSLSYFTLVRSLIPQTNEDRVYPSTALSRSDGHSQGRGRADTIWLREKDREKSIEQATRP